VKDILLLVEINLDIPNGLISPEKETAGLINIAEEDGISVTIQIYDSTFWAIFRER
jgi:hypothetical protein